MGCTILLQFVQSDKNSPGSDNFVFFWSPDTASIPLKTLSDSCFTRWLTSVNMYEYEILAFDRQVAG